MHFLARGEPTEATPARPRGKRFALLLAGGLLLGFAVLYAAAYLFLSDRVPRDVSVAGVHIGGMAPFAAQEKLEDELVPRADEAIIATLDGREFKIEPERAGLSLDVEATVQNAGGGRSFSPLRMIRVLTGGEPVKPVVDVDESKLKDELKTIADKVNEEPAAGSITFNSTTPKPEFPAPGTELNVERAAVLAAAAYVAEDPVFELPMRDVEPELGDSDIRQALEGFAKPAMSGPVTVQVPGRKVRLAPAQLAPALSVEVVGGELKPQIDQKKLTQSAGKKLRRLSKPPQNADVVLRDGEPHIVRSRPGTKVRGGQVAAKLLPVLTKTGDERVARVDAKTAKAKFTTKDARGLGIKEEVSEFTTYYPHAEYRNVNIGRAAELINGTLLKPGEIFSLNETLGERTEENGYTTGYVISGGVLKEDLGGGVSQASTTTYNAAFFAGLKDIEHRPHSFYIDRYPMGREATVLWGSFDMRFQNDTPYGILIQSWINPSTPGTEGSITVRMWSTKYWTIKADRSEQYDWTSPSVQYDTSSSCVTQYGHSGFEVDVYRHFHRGGERVKTEKWHVTYNPAPTVRCEPPPSEDDDGGSGGGTGNGGGGSGNGGGGGGG